ncbi:MAG: BREX protein BrxB domain-containing protein [Byssovorax sp.]
MSTQNEIIFRTDLSDGIAALRRDLRGEDGPRISTIRNYNFALLPYPPEEEFKLRARIHQLSAELVEEGWIVRSIALQTLLFQRLRALGEDYIENVIATEHRLYTKAKALSRTVSPSAPEAAMTHLMGKLAQHIEGPQGLAADVEREIDRIWRENPDKADRTVIFIGRAGALYPFFRTSGLLKHLDGKTHNLPVVLLYPGERRDTTALSFMGVLEPDRDYRPRIYP